MLRWVVWEKHMGDVCEGERRDMAGSKGEGKGRKDEGMGGDGEEGDNDDDDIVEHGSFVGDRFYWL